MSYTGTEHFGGTLVVLGFVIVVVSVSFISPIAAGIVFGVGLMVLGYGAFTRG